MFRKYIISERQNFISDKKSLFRDINIATAQLVSFSIHKGRWFCMPIHILLMRALIAREILRNKGAQCKTELANRMKPETFKRFKFLKLFCGKW